MIIQAKEYVSTGFDSDDAKIISNLTDNLLQKGESVTIDFTGIDLFCTYFFRLALVYRFETMSKNEYDEKIKVVGLNKPGKAAYQTAYDGAVSYYRLTPELRRELDMEIAELIEEYL
ncbi:hypothetical protein MmiAt1_17650 [Methanimicrococcus sp. At1]|uniref:DUF4325 domain-containing protein n=1 Tax=Methanimicrococcus hacksteinii TaxID=3028293 RepID=A0ABU3VRV1_9EURY|nr:DUF4325 domain-containing protein [Methanimicrococcus sp. At1]MDV0446148.1 hypothetical protein [Methanimicrococcus sp. At1]